MKVCGIVGWKNSGKTSVIERLVREMTQRGLTISTLKHAHHDVDLDHPGTDAFRHRMAGATEVVLASANRFAVLHENRLHEPDLSVLLARLAPVDLVLAEGYKRGTHFKIEVFRRETGQPLLQSEDSHIRAVASDASIEGITVPLLDLNDTVAIADFIQQELKLGSF